MKRNKEKVPEFDDIIFENRNKTYGAYDLRKRYKSAASLSLLGGIALCTALMIALSFNTEDGTAFTGPQTIVIVISDPVVPENVTPPTSKPPAELTNAIKNLQPVVITDTSQITSYIPTTEELTKTITNANITDPVIFIEPTDPVIQPETKPFTSVQEPPEYPGGLTALLKFISENINYPSDAQNNNIQGKVILKFVVNADGSVDRIEVIRSIDPSLDNEAIRVVQMLPWFKPGKQGGVPVPVWFILPIVFRLENNLF